MKAKLSKSQLSKCQWALVALVSALALTSCQSPVMEEDVYRRPEFRRSKGLREIRATDSTRAIALIRQEADLATLRPEDIRPLAFHTGGRLPAYMDPGPGETRFAIASNGRRPVIYFVVSGIEWTPRMIYGVLLDWRVSPGPVTRALVWKERQ